MILSRFPHMEIQNHNHTQKNEFIPIFQFPVFLRLHTDWKSDKSNSCAFPISVFETGCDDAGGGAFESICTKLTPRPVVGKERRAVLLLQHSTTITITKQQHPAPVAHQVVLEQFWLFLAIAWAFLSRFIGSFGIFHCTCARNPFLHLWHD